MEETAIPLILRPKKAPTITLLIVCALFVTLGVQDALDGKWIGYFIGGSFGLFALVYIRLLTPGGALRITEDGISYTVWFRKTVSWDEISRFFVGSTGSWPIDFKYVRFQYAQSPFRAKTRFSRLPSKYSKTAEELADMLNRRLAEFREKTAARK